MSAEPVGTPGVRHLLVSGTGFEHAIFPLAFSASVLPEDDAVALGNIYEQVALASAANVRLITVALTLGSFLHHGGRLSAADRRLLRRVIQLAPEAFVILRVSLAGGATLGMEVNTLMSATNGTTILCGCSWATKGGGPNGTDDCASPTTAWAEAAGVQLQRLLRAADAAIPGRLVGVQLVGLSTGEWELPHDDFVYTNGTFDCNCCPLSKLCGHPAPHALANDVWRV
jgi:hypothetical protein